MARGMVPACRNNRPRSGKELHRKRTPDRLTEAYLLGAISGLTPFLPQNGQKELIVPFYAGSTEGNPRLPANLGAKDDCSAGQTLKPFRPQFETKHDGN